MKKLLSLLILAVVAMSARAIDVAQIAGGVWQSEVITEEIPQINSEGGTSMVIAFTENGKCAVCHNLSFKIKLGPDAFAQATGLMQGKGTYVIKNNKITITIGEEGYTFLIPPETVVAENVPDEALAEQMKQGCVEMLTAVSQEAPKHFKFMTLKNVAVSEDGVLTFKFDDDNYTLTRIK